MQLLINLSYGTEEVAEKAITFRLRSYQRPFNPDCWMRYGLWFARRSYSLRMMTSWRGLSRVEPLDGCDGDVVVDHSQFLCCLVTEEVIRFNTENTLPQGTVVLCNKAMNPCLTRPCWRNNDGELLTLRQHHSSDSCLQFIMPIIYDLITDLLRQVVNGIQGQRVFQTSGLLQIKIGNLFT